VEALRPMDGHCIQSGLAVVKNPWRARSFDEDPRRTASKNWSGHSVTVLAPNYQESQLSRISGERGERFASHVRVHQAYFEGYTASLCHGAYEVKHLPSVHFRTFSPWLFLVACGLLAEHWPLILSSLDNRVPRHWTVIAGMTTSYSL
jgi:hypothetical protein